MEQVAGAAAGRSTTPLYGEIDGAPSLSFLERTDVFGWLASQRACTRPNLEKVSPGGLLLRLPPSLDAFSPSIYGMARGSLTLVWKGIPSVVRRWVIAVSKLLPKYRIRVSGDPTAIVSPGAQGRLMNECGRPQSQGLVGYPNGALSARAS